MILNSLFYLLFVYLFLWTIDEMSEMSWRELISIDTIIEY